MDKLYTCEDCGQWQVDCECEKQTVDDFVSPAEAHERRELKKQSKEG